MTYRAWPSRAGTMSGPAWTRAAGLIDRAQADAPEHAAGSPLAEPAEELLRGRRATAAARHGRLDCLAQPLALGQVGEQIVRGSAQVLPPHGVVAAVHDDVGVLAREGRMI